MTDNRPPDARTPSGPPLSLDQLVGPHGRTMKKPETEITALELVAFRLYANAQIGKPEHAKALKLLEEAKQIWRDKFKRNRCPHCGK